MKKNNQQNVNSSNINNYKTQNGNNNTNNSTNYTKTISKNIPENYYSELNNEHTKYSNRNHHSDAHKSVNERYSNDRRTDKLQAVENRRARSRSITMTFFVLIIMVFTVFIILGMMKKNAPKPQFAFIQTGTIEHATAVNAVIIRDDVILTSPANGTIKPLIPEGNRVSFGQNVAMIIGNGANDSLISLKNCEQQISNLQLELMNQGKGAGARVIYDETDKDLIQLIDLARKDSIYGNLTNTDSYEASIKVLLERRDTRLLSIDFRDSRLTELKAQKAGLEKSLGLLSGVIKSNSPGIVSYHLDGYEQTLTTKDIESINYDKYIDVIKNSKIELTTGKIVEKNNKVLRITTGIFQYIAIYLPDTNASTYAKGSIHTINLPMEGINIENCKVYKSTVVDGGVFILFQTDRQLDRFSDRRIFQGNLIIGKTSGMKVPVSSILKHDKTAQTGEILIVSGGYTRIAKIKVLDYDREYAIIDKINGQKYNPTLNGYLVKNPLSIKEGENIGGVNN